MIKTLLLSFFIILGFGCISQSASDQSPKNKYKISTKEVLISAGYNYCALNFLDVGLRYYHLRNESQSALALSGFSVGTEISFSKNENTYIPYLGWQGQKMFVAYGIRAEYGISNNTGAFSFSPEIGLSLLEIIRITGGYRFVVENHDPMELSGFRFSIIAAMPLSFFRKSSK